jgi:UDP-N-acetylglucosamine:LPS N-acetylglucosamine transferase
MTLVEACALGVPIVVLAVVPAQRPAARAVAAAGAALDAGHPDPRFAAARAARAVLRLLRAPRHARQLAARAQELVDGAGAARVAARLRTLAGRTRVEELRRAA